MFEGKVRNSTLVLTMSFIWSLYTRKIRTYRIIMNRSFWSCIRELLIRLIPGFCPCIMRRPDLKILVPAVNSERVSGLFFSEAGILPF